MATFALVHGSMHGGWCWRDLVPELEGRGHRVVAPDLPCEDVEAGLGEYAATVERALDAIGAAHEIVLVGHSLGCRTIPVVASRRRRSRLVFLCSVPTGPGPVDPESFSGMVTEEFTRAEVEERADGARRMRPESAKRVFYHDCDEETAAWAASRLRWQGPKPLTEAMPFDDWPDVPTQIVLTRDDRAVRAEWAMGEASTWLGNDEPIFLPGSHSPFFSHPAELADVLEHLASS
ncbi:MAG: alpha/beta hydrolase [Deltaproteobacteria bacterium]|jgi:pimeloyl-ACP methyl ester carboxylesterase|nr:alpha/beta hydrolase [Deltaproteobacteria bacterium]